MVLICGQERGPTGDAAGPYPYNSKPEMLYSNWHRRPALRISVTVPEDSGEKNVVANILIPAMNA